jgi:hypothetical protein
VLSSDFEEGKSGKVRLSDGEALVHSPPPSKALIPDMSTYKPIAHLFHRTGYQVYPAWLYHPSEEAVLVQDAEEAMKYGVFYRETTQDERMRGMLKATWDWSPDTQWRPQPYPKKRVYDPKNPESGKNYEEPRPNYQQAQHDMLAALVAGLGNLKGDSGGGITPETLAQAMTLVMQNMAPKPQVNEETKRVVEAHAAELASIEADAQQERDLWIKEAKALGIKVDRRWGLERLKSEVEEARQTAFADVAVDDAVTGRADSAG